MMISKNIGTILLLLVIALNTTSCKKSISEINPENFHVALPTSPVKVINPDGNWLVYEMHMVTPILERVDIFQNNTLLMTYSDFLSRDNINIASIWLEFPEAGWESNDLVHIFYYKDENGESNEFSFNLETASEYPDPITISFPVSTGTWLAEGAPSTSSYHTRAIFPFSELYFDKEQNGYLIGNNPQRYAIDYCMIQDGLPYKNDGKNLEDWFCYNLPILAAEGGKVLFTENNIPDNLTPGELDYETDHTNVTGNVVYIEHQDGSIGTYCHMIPNSIIVKAGDIISAGQELGRLGNSGNSFAPHLHMHIIDNPEGKQIINYSDGLYFESLPYKFSTFTKLGTLPLGYLDEKPIYQFIPTMSKLYNNMLPSESDVIQF